MLKQKELIMNILWQAKHWSGSWGGLLIWVKLTEGALYKKKEILSLWLETVRKKDLPWYVYKSVCICAHVQQY